MTVHLLIPASLTACLGGWMDQPERDVYVCENREDIHLTTLENPCGEPRYVWFGKYWDVNSMALKMAQNCPENGPEMELKT